MDILLSVQLGWVVLVTAAAFSYVLDHKCPPSGKNEVSWGVQDSSSGSQRSFKGKSHTLGITEAPRTHFPRCWDS